jgi:hypothetical protein
VSWPEPNGNESVDLIPERDVHPNNEGMNELRKVWAKMMATLTR